MLFIYSNSKFVVTSKTRPLDAGTSGLIPKRERLTLYYPFCLFIRKNTLLNYHPESFAIYTTLKEVGKLGCFWKIETGSSEPFK